MKRILSLFLCLAVLVSCFCFTTASAAGNLSTDKTEYGVGEPIMVTANGSGDQWVGIYLANESVTSTTSIYWYYVETYGSGNAVNIKETESNNRTDVASIPVGEYKIVLFADGGYTIAETTYISVVEVDASNTTYDIKVNGNEVADGEVLTVTNDGDITLQPAAIGGPAGEAWVGVYHAYYGKLTPYQSASGNMTDYKYVSAGSWNLSGVLWSGRSTVVLFGDGGYSKILKVFYIQFNGFREADFDFNGKEIENDTVVTVYKGYEQAVLNMTVGSDAIPSHGKPWYAIYNGVSGSSTIDYSGHHAPGNTIPWEYISTGDYNITSKLQEGRNTVVVYGSEQYNDIRKCIVIDYVTPDFSVDVDTLDSAAIRLDKKGLRFYTDVDEDKIAELVVHGATVEAGTLIGPADLNPDALTLETNPNNVVDVKFDLNNKDGYFKDGDFEGVVGTLAEIREENIARDFVARGYVKVTIGGQTYVSYSAAQATRSLRTVAQGIKANTAYYDTLPTEFQANVNAWAAAADFGA